MAQSKDDITFGTAQARVSEDDALRIRYKAGTPLEEGKIADSKPVDLFSSAHNIERARQQQAQTSSRPQMPSDDATGAGRGEAAGGKRIPPRELLDRCWTASSGSWGAIANIFLQSFCSS